MSVMLGCRVVYILFFYVSLSTVAFSAVLTRVIVDPQLAIFVQKLEKKLSQDQEEIKRSVERLKLSHQKGDRPPHVFVVGRAVIKKLMADELSMLSVDINVNIFIRHLWAYLKSSRHLFYRHCQSCVMRETSDLIKNTSSRYDLLKYFYVRNHSDKIYSIVEIREHSSPPKGLWLPEDANQSRMTRCPINRQSVILTPIKTSSCHKDKQERIPRSPKSFVLESGSSFYDSSLLFEAFQTQCEVLPMLGLIYYGELG